MGEARQLFAHLGHPRRVDDRQREAVAILAFGDHFAPRIDDERVAVGAPPIIVLAVLGGRDDVALAFDGAGCAARYASGRRR